MLQVERGATDYQVFQRNSDNEAFLELIGICDVGADSVVEAQVLNDGRVIQGWMPVTPLERGRWQANLCLKTGGPYTISLRLRSRPEEVVEVRHLLVGDLWVLAGQSNMEGVGDLVDVEEPHPLVHNYTMSESWEIAREPLHWLCCSVDLVHNPENIGFSEEQHAEWHRTRQKGAGLGLPFAKMMVQESGVPIGLIPCAQGGTSMSQWDPALANLGGASLYGSMLRRVRAVGGKVKGVLWFQGESDANPVDAPHFAERFTNFVRRIRVDLADAQLPFYYAQIGRFVCAMPVEGELAWSQLQDVQRRLAEQIPYTAVVATIDLELDDLIHTGTQGLKRLGRRLARIALRELFGRSEIERGPRPLQVVMDNPDRTRVRVRFADVNGRLTALGRVSGFSVRSMKHHEYPIIYKMEVDPRSPCDVLLHLTEACPRNAFLWYGYEIDPYCNLTDEADMAVPVFGPVAIEG